MNDLYLEVQWNTAFTKYLPMVKSLPVNQRYSKMLLLALQDEMDRLNDSASSNVSIIADSKRKQVSSPKATTESESSDDSMTQMPCPMEKYRRGAGGSIIAVCESEPIDC